MDEPKRLLKPHEMADILQVATSWIYRQTMMTGTDSIPRMKIGKYLRFEPEKVIEWVRQRNMRNE